MKTSIVILVISQAIVLSLWSQPLFAWSGDTWAPISRELILRNATEMIHFSWTPNKTFSNWEVGSKRKSFYAGTLYHGETYTQGPQQSYSEFHGSVNSTAGGNTSYGNDCSGFVSMSWRLPSRYTTSSFESDATTDGGYVTKLGNIGSGPAVAQSLLPGDAFVRSDGISNHLESTAFPLIK